MMCITRCVFLCVLVAGAFGVFLASGDRAVAQSVPGVTDLLGSSQPAPEDALTPEQKLETLLQLMGDPDVQAALAQAGVAQAGGGQAGGVQAGAAASAINMDQSMSANAFFEQKVRQARNFGSKMRAGFKAFPGELQDAVIIMALELQGGKGWALLLNFFLFIAVGLLCEWVYRHVTRDLYRHIAKSKATHWRQRLQFTSQRFLLNMGAVAVFGLGSVGMFLMQDWAPLTRLIVQSALLAALVIRCIQALLLFFLAPRKESLRMLRLNTRAALSIYRLLMAVAIVGVCAFATVDVFRLMGFFEISVVVLWNFAGVLVGLVLLAGVWIHYLPIRHHLEELYGRNSSIAALWALAASAYILVTTACWFIGMRPLVVILLLIPVARILDVIIKQAVTTWVEGWSSAPLSAPESVNPFIPTIMRIVRLLLLLAYVDIVARMIGLDLYGDSAGIVDFMSMAVDVVVALLLADLVWQFTRSWISKRLEAEGGEMDLAGQADEGGGVGGTRLQTLLPLLRKTVQGTLVIMTALIVLSSLGVNIGPILAGAGVVGIAIGFGAQALVRDIVSGVFFLIDDAFRIGEYIEMGELRGKVEGISLRSLRLRHHKGAIHTIPFGELTHITNYSRDWVLMRLEFHMPFDTDVAKVKKIVKKVGLELLEDPTFGHHFLMAPKSQGVRRMEEFNMVIAVKFMTVPGEQWVIRRETYHRILAAFEANGIKLATREVKVAASNDAPLTDAQKLAVAEQASEQLELPSPGLQP